MSLKHDFCHNQKMKLIAYEEMIDEKSYVFVKCGSEEIKLPIAAWRELNHAWNEKAWDVKFDSLSNCIPELENNTI